MKKQFLLVMLVSLLAVGLVISCDDDDGGSFLGSTLNLTGAVSTVTWDANYSPTFTPFTGTRTLAPAGFWDERTNEYVTIGGTGTITNGQLSYSIGTPTRLVNVSNLLDENMGGYTNVTVRPENAQMAEIRFLYLTEQTGELRKIFGNANGTTWERVTYYYVDRDVRITATGGDIRDGGYTYRLRDINLNLKAGWNAITEREELSGTTFTVTTSTGDPSRARWALEEWDYN